MLKAIFGVEFFAYFILSMNIAKVVMMPLRFDKGFPLLKQLPANTLPHISWTQVNSEQLRPSLAEINITKPNEFVG